MSRKRIDRQERALEVIDINTKGMGVAKNKEGAVYFIKNVVPGDIVDIRAYKKRRGYFEAEPITWVKKSDQRIRWDSQKIYVKDLTSIRRNRVRGYVIKWEDEYSEPWEETDEYVTFEKKT